MSTVPITKYFGVPGSGGYPGVPAYSGTTNIGGTDSSAVGWIANSPIGNPKIYDYAYFYNKIPADILGGFLNPIASSSIQGTDLSSGGTPDANGYYWYKYDGTGTGLDLTLSTATNLGSRKVILLVDNANFNINAPINLTDGQGFFMVIVKGNIVVDPTVTGAPALEGMYVADGTFTDSVSPLQLHARGSVVAYGGIQMKRDLGVATNATTPSELFEFAPDQNLLFPKVLSSRKINWKEVAP